jgi:NADH-quinone oxidoreductase subunit D
MLEGDYLADVPIVIAAIDPCFSCTDRMAVRNLKGSDEKIFDQKSIRDFGIDWYRNNRDIDFTHLNKKLLKRLERV